MSVFFITLILFVAFFVVKVRKVLAEPLQESKQVCDLEEIIEEDTLQEKVSCCDVERELHRAEEKVSEQVRKEEKQIVIEQNRKFSLKEAVIYSAILERPYK
jgi:cell division protein FtsL